MITLTEDVNKLFNEVLVEISQNVRSMMEELWLNWSHLGVDDNTKVNNITKLVQIEKELHRDVISETRQKLKTMQGQVDKLKEETEELSRCLSVDITILDFKEDMMLVEYKRELEEQIAGYREQVEQRRMKMERLLEWQRDLADKLGVTIQELQEVPLPAEEELDKLKEHLEMLQAERDKRAETFLNIQVEIKDIMDKLRIKPQNKFEHIVTSSLSVDFKVLELRERLTKLWECLDEDQIYRENFLHAHPGCHPQTEAAIKEEIKRCDQIKRQKIQVFVANVRTKIKLMWDSVMYSSREREEFVHYYQDIFTEDTLTLHELYLEKITKYYNDHKHIFELVVTRKNLWLKMTELEARATEPGRYHNRGGQLLREEKERKAIASNLPKIEAQIRELVSEYEAKTGNIFTVDGKPLLQLMEDEWETRKAERHNKLSARKQALTPTTPLFRSLATSPLGKRNRTAAGLAATAERNRPPSKRQLITGSATKAVTTFTNNLSALKRSAITTVKRRISGRLAARAVAEGKDAKRKLDYGGELRKTPKVNGSILKHKRTSHGKRHSSSRRSINATRSTGSQEEDRVANKDPLMETTLLTTYTDFKDGINEKQISRSSMANQRPNEPILPTIVYHTIDERNGTPKKTPRVKTPLTPKVGKENIQHVNAATPKSNLLYTPTRLTRSALKLNNDGFATPRAPLSANKVNLQRQNTVASLTVKTTPNNAQGDTMRPKKDVPKIIIGQELLKTFEKSDSEEAGEKILPGSPVVPSICASVVDMLEEDPFDYDIVNIDTTLFNVTEGKSFEIHNLVTTPYITLDKPRFSDTEIQIANDETPENVFIINSVGEANKALDYVKKFADDYSTIHKSGLAYDGGVVIDYECRTLDPYVFAAGPCTRYHKRYYADAQSHKYYDSTEIGEKGFVFETYKTGYFKVHLNKELVVDGLTCLCEGNFSLENFKYLYGRPASELNNMHLRYMANKLDDFFEFFRSPWAFFLYHDHTNDLFSMIKQLYPKTLTMNSKLDMQRRFENSPHIGALTEYLIDWLSQHDILLPMYLQPVVNFAIHFIILLIWRNLNLINRLL
ncbi:unnamed protein product [Spodoptera littoralis]|uniref:CFAP61 dimerisation domain-containing protein n=1 Tax=Spodoptera littoralis TaxID=7109 RepID=A0A9P0HZY5_SPOLI|nr:unnamed protein product [Spodoptera littoralis]